MDQLIQCAACKLWLPQNSFYQRKPPRKPYTSCKSCVCARSSAYALAYPERVAAKQMAYREKRRREVVRTCCKCKQTLPSGEFFGCSSCCKSCYKTSYAITRSDYYSVNRSLINRKRSEYLIANTAQINARRRAYLVSHKSELSNYYKRQAEQLSDAYLKKMIRRCSHVSSHQIPDDLVAAKKAHLKLKRLIKEKLK